MSAGAGVLCARVSGARRAVLGRNLIISIAMFAADLAWGAARNVSGADGAYLDCRALAENLRDLLGVPVEPRGEWIRLYGSSGRNEQFVIQVEVADRPTVELAKTTRTKGEPASLTQRGITISRGVVDLLRQSLRADDVFRNPTEDDIYWGMRDGSPVVLEYQEGAASRYACNTGGVSARSANWWYAPRPGTRHSDWRTFYSVTSMLELLAQYYVPPAAPTAPGSPSPSNPASSAASLTR